MAWTRKSSRPHFSLMAEGLVHRRIIGDVALDEDVEPTSAASGSTRFFSASP